MNRHIFILIVIFILSLMASAQDFPNYPMQSASEYPNSQTKDGVHAALQLLSDVTEQKKYLGVNLSEQGFLPVLMVVENGTEGSSVLLQTELVTHKVENLAASDSGKKVNISTKKGVAMTFVPFTAGFLGLKGIKDAYKVKQNIMVKHLQSKTIPPGKTHSGFLYIPVGKNGTEERKLTLNIKLSFDDKQEGTNITFEVNIPKDSK